MTGGEQSTPRAPAKNATAAAIRYLSSPGEPITEDVEYLIAILEMEAQREGTEVAYWVGFEAVGLGMIAAVIALNPPEMWVRGVIVIGGGALVLSGIIAILNQSVRAVRRSEALVDLYDARRKHASHRWWHRFSK